MDHFPKVYPTRPIEVSKQGPKTNLSHIGVVPSPNNLESKIERISIKVVTRAQSRQNIKKQMETKIETSKQGTKRRTNIELAKERAGNQRQICKGQKRAYTNQERNEIEPWSKKFQMKTKNRAQNQALVD